MEIKTFISIYTENIPILPLRIIKEKHGGSLATFQFDFTENRADTKHSRLEKDTSPHLRGKSFCIGFLDVQRYISDE